jgi:uncharacterized protein YodC (DUF2158 family)
MSKQENTFVVGVSVKLNSGGNAMTIEEVDCDEVVCVDLETKKRDRYNVNMISLWNYGLPTGY